MPYSTQLESCLALLVEDSCIGLPWKEMGTVLGGSRS